jgi:subtilisin family serine protease
LLVGFSAGVGRLRAEEILNFLGATAVDKIPQIDVHIIQIPPAALEALEKALSRRPEVEFVERNSLLPPVQIPNDSEYLNQWHLPMIFGPEAWEISQGVPEAIIAVLDSGVDPTHEDLAGKLIPGYNFFNGDTDTSDVYGHGTKVAGAATAISDNGTGVASVAWQNLLMPIRVTDARGYGYVSAIAQGLTYAVDNGAKVMNLSFAGVAGSPTIANAAQYVVSQGGLVVAAAGNCGCFDWMCLRRG